MDGQRFVHRKTVERRTVSHVDETETGCRNSRAQPFDRGSDRRPQFRGNVGDDFGRSDSRQFGQQLFVGVVTAQRRRRDVARRNVGVGQCEGLSHQRDCG